MPFDNQSNDHGGGHGGGDDHNGGSAEEHLRVAVDALEAVQSFADAAGYCRVCFASRVMEVANALMMMGTVRQLVARGIDEDQALHLACRSHDDHMREILTAVCERFGSRMSGRH